MEPSGSCRTCVDPRVVSCWAAYFAKTSAAAAVGIAPDTTTPVAGGAAAATLKRIIEGAMPSIVARSDLTESSFDAVYSLNAPAMASCTVAVLGIAKLGAPVLGVAGLNTQNNTFLKIRPIIAASSRAAHLAEAVSSGLMGTDVRTGSFGGPVGVIECMGSMGAIEGNGLGVRVVGARLIR